MSDHQAAQVGKTPPIIHEHDSGNSKQAHPGQASSSSDEGQQMQFPLGDGETGFWRRITGEQRGILVLLAWTHFVNFSALAIFAPLFPVQAESKGMTQSVAGFVFGCFPFVVAITSPVWGKLMTLVGIRYMISAGVFVSGVCSVLLGFLETVHTLQNFTILSFVLRIIQALGSSAFRTGSFTLVTQTFSTNIGVTMGILEVFVGVGSSVGPATGGYLYEIGGYYLPFLTLGLCKVMTVPLCLHVLPDGKGASDEKPAPGMAALLTNGRVLTVLSVIAAIGTQMAFLDPSLEPHLSQFTLSASQVGLFFLLLSAVYSISCVVWGRVSDAIADKKWVLMSIGLAGTAFAFLLIGPSPLLPILPSSVWLNLVSVFFLATFCAMAHIPTYQSLVDCVTGASSATEVDLSSCSVVAGMWNSAYSIGEILGPSTGGILVDHWGFPLSSTVMGSVAFLTSLALLTSRTVSCASASCREAGTNKCEGTPLLGSGAK